MEVTKTYVVMGVSGSGKSTIGKKISKYFGYNFYDGDDFHPQSNIEKMSKGQPLNDEDREPWLLAINNHILQQKDSTFYACSALKKSYREIIAKNVSSIDFIYLKGSFELIYNRIGKRKDHFMPPELLRSQFEILEEPENAIVVDIAKSQADVIIYLKKELK